MAQGKISKNARTGSAAHKHHCKCGGEIKMFTQMKNAKLKHMARCESCKKEGRRPKDLM